MIKYKRAFFEELKTNKTKYANSEVEEWKKISNSPYVYESDEYIYVFKSKNEACNLVIELGISLYPVRRPPLEMKSGALRALLNSIPDPDPDPLTPESCLQGGGEQSTSPGPSKPRNDGVSSLL